MKERILYLDIIRIIACIMIIAMHAPIPNTGLSSYVLSTDSLLTVPGIGLFIMVSGALLLPVNMPTEQFLKKRFAKIVFPTVLWTLFYYMIAPYTDTVTQGFGIKSFLSIPFSSQFNGVLWFMYMLAGLYLLAPILSAWLRQASRREVRFYLFLWGITLCYPIIRSYIGVNESHTGILYYFGGYAGYFLLGYYLKTYVDRIAFWKCLLLMVLPISIAVVIKIKQLSIDFYDLFWYLSIFVVMMAIAWFLLIKRQNIPYHAESVLHRNLVLVSNCCFGIYLVHIFIMRSIIWQWEWLQDLGVIQILTVTLLTFVGSFAVTWLISYLPGAEYIIGFKQKK
ncbi:MAG: acyltransferase family protein [Aeriscardovia sp.]|nr:acyltransferase family protein [Aeriscardovia sp.]